MSRKIYNLIGKHFGHLTVIAQADKPYKSTQKFWLCKCDCGKSTIVTTGNLNSGRTISCGHVRGEKVRQYHLEHFEEMRLHHLNDKPHSNKKGKYRNIYSAPKNKFRVIVSYNKETHFATCSTLKDALIKREELRAEYWPNYTPLSADEALKEKGQ